jgi:hypothetical protein
VIAAAIPMFMPPDGLDMSEAGNRAATRRPCTHIQHGTSSTSLGYGFREVSCSTPKSSHASPTDLRPRRPQTRTARRMSVASRRDPFESSAGVVIGTLNGRSCP